MIKKIKKEQVLIIALFGVLCIVLWIPIPASKEQEPEQITEKEIQQPDTLEQQLKHILQKISGVGAVEVLITYTDKGTLVVEKDEAVSEELIQEADGSGGTRTTTTVQKERQTIFENGEHPLIVQEISPAVEGVLVVAQGAGNVSVKKQIEEVIEALFGLDAHKISIMKMEVSR